MATEEPTSAYDRIVKLAGLSETHKHILASVPDGSRVLELGPSSGYMTRVLAARGCRVDAIEYSPADAALAAQSCVRMVVGSLDDDAPWVDLRGPYDVAIMADVLEHLRAPETVLARVRNVLANDGVALISLPNIAHWRPRLALLFGRFDYTEMGIMDRTHLRFFTRKTTLAMIHDAGFSIERIFIPPMPGSRLGRSYEWLRQNIPTLFSMHFTYHIRPRHD
jgi:2-polyprenyl-3-methyl-5-hydroxy-6-metoxy-1,4-benzoquinol methylase